MLGSIARGGIRSKWLRVIVALVIVAVLALPAFRLASGQWLWTWASSRFRPVTHLAKAVLDSGSVSKGSEGNFTNVIFLHHSVGEHLIEQGGVREVFAESGFDFWDHGYNGGGLRRPDGSHTAYSYNVPDNNTDPDGLAAIFAQDANELPINTLSGLYQHEVIAFKSCFPNSQITSDAKLEQFKSYYLSIRDEMDQHPEKLFVVISPPPLNPAVTETETAARARAFADWLGSDEYRAGYPNVFVFDFFDQLAESDSSAADYNMLREAFREANDSHPNQLANQIVGPLFADFVMSAIQSYRDSY